jgi:hypothetical protein
MACYCCDDPRRQRPAEPSGGRPLAFLSFADPAHTAWRPVKKPTSSTTRATTSRSQSRFDGETYTRDEVRHFVEMAGFSQVALRQPDFVKQIVEIENEAVGIAAFPSVKATTYAVWHKVYADRNRKWTHSDAFDIIIPSAIPYVDAVVTESHLAEGLRKTTRLDDFIEHLPIHTLRDFRHSASRAAPLEAAR